VDLPTYTNIWRIEKRLYKLYDFRLPAPLPITWIGVFVGITVPYIFFLVVIGLPFNHNLVWLYVLPPGVLTWLTTRPVIESKRLPELVSSQLRYVSEPRTWVRLAPLTEKDEILVSVRVWHRHPPGSRSRKLRNAVGRARQAQAAVQLAATATADAQLTVAPAVDVPAAPAPETTRPAVTAPVPAASAGKASRAAASTVASWRAVSRQLMSVRPRAVRLGPSRADRHAPDLASEPEPRAELPSDDAYPSVRIISASELGRASARVAPPAPPAVQPDAVQAAPPAPPAIEPEVSRAAPQPAGPPLARPASRPAPTRLPMPERATAQPKVKATTARRSWPGCPEQDV
jgi:hypothetical protein